jgi:excisionase family DNA binding protein
MLMVHYETVLELIAKGELPAAKVGRSYVFLTQDVIDYVQKAINQQTAERMCWDVLRPWTQPRRFWSILKTP